MNYARGMMDKSNTIDGVEVAKKVGTATASELITKRDGEIINPRDAKQAALMDMKNTAPEAIAARAELAATRQVATAQFAVLGAAATSSNPVIAAALGSVAIEQIATAQGLGKSLSDRIVSTDMKIDVKEANNVVAQPARNQTAITNDLKTTVAAEKFERY